MAHLLLAKIYKDAKMYSALIYMMTGYNKSRHFRFNSRLYGRMREQYSIRASIEHKGMNAGSKNPMYGKNSWEY